MKSLKHRLCAVATAGLAALSLTGCYHKINSSDFAKTVAATYKDQKITLQDVNFFTTQAQLYYDMMYAYMGSYYGYTSLEAFYTTENNGKSLWDSIREQAMATIYQTKILCDLAPQYNVSLSDDDKQKVYDAVATYMAEADPLVLSYMGATQDYLTGIYMDNALANLVYEEIVKDFDKTLVDEDYRYRMVTYVNVKSAQNDNKEDLATEKEVADKASAFELAFKAFEESVQSGTKQRTDFSVSEIKDELSAEAFSITSAEKRTFGKLGESPTDLEKAISEMSTGEIKLLPVTDSGTYIIYCLDDDDAASRKNAVDQEYENRKSKLFEEKYPAIQQAAAPLKVKNDVMKSLVYQELKTTPQTTAPTTTAEETTAEETTAGETTAGETTAEETTGAETTTEAAPEETTEAAPEETTETSEETTEAAPEETTEEVPEQSTQEVNQ